jgi:hypothetical protein
MIKRHLEVEIRRCGQNRALLRDLDELGEDAKQDLYRLIRGLKEDAEAERRKARRRSFGWPR